MTMPEIAKEVAAEHDISLQDLHSSSRLHTICHARQEAMVRMLLAGRSTTQVGNYFGRDHSTVIHAKNAVTKRQYKKEGRDMGMKSGGRVDLGGFCCGWVKTLPVKSLAHYANKKENHVFTKCGRTIDGPHDSAGLVLFHPGNFTHCQRCEAALGWGPEDLS